MKPYSESCDQNRTPILAVIQPLLSSKQSVLEIGSGTGQHAVFFAEKLPHLSWQTSDQLHYHAGIEQWIEASTLSNVLAPLSLNVSQDSWPDKQYDAVYSANTCHIMHWCDVEALFVGVAKVLKSGGLFLLYGPFNYQGRFTSESNARFDQWLKSRDIDSGIRDFEAVNSLAEQAGMILMQDEPMPANNRMLCWSIGS